MVRAHSKKLELEFVECDLTELELLHQVKVFAKAHTVVAPHGAGSVFLAAMSPKSRFVELNGNGNMLYLRMALMYDLNITAIPYDQDSGVVDLNLLQEVL